MRLSKISWMSSKSNNKHFYLKKKKKGRRDTNTEDQVKTEAETGIV